MKLKLFGQQHQQQVLQAAGAAEGNHLQDAYDEEFYPEPQLLGSPEPSQPGSVRTPADLSQEPSAVAEAAASAAGGLLAEASAGSQQLLPNLLLSEEDLLQEALYSSTSVSGSRRNFDPGSYDTSLAAERSSGSFRAAHATSSRLATSRSSSSINAADGASAGSSSAIGKALFADACLPSTPKSCSLSNLRVMASRNSCEWQQGAGGNSGSSQGGSSLQGSRCYSNSSSWTADGDDERETDEAYGRSSKPAAGSTAGLCAGSTSSHSSSKSHAVATQKATATAAADDAQAADDEDFLLAAMDVCLGSLHTAVQLARTTSGSGERRSSAGASAAGERTSATGLRWSLSSSGRKSSAAADAAAEACPGGAALSTRQMQRNKSRLSSGQLEGAAASHMPASCKQLPLQLLPCDNSPGLLRVGSRGRAGAWSDCGSPSGSRGRPVAWSDGGSPHSSWHGTDLRTQQQQVQLLQQHAEAEQQAGCEGPASAPPQQQQGSAVQGSAAQGHNKHSSVAGAAAAAAAGQLGMSRSR
uniref:Uncharacterized protein n=1 Tax=Tetradesmus obliquus TaxID=3088 RepID=A0A383VT60_TETOB|eukprot:jgi/Sobl393_1/5166/SZX67999.1